MGLMDNQHIYHMDYEMWPGPSGKSITAPAIHWVSENNFNLIRNKQMHSKSFGELKKIEGFPWHGGIIQNFTILVLKPHGDLGIPALTIRARCLLGQGMKPLNQSLAICSVYKTIGVLHENKSICYISISIYIYTQYIISIKHSFLQRAPLSKQWPTWKQPCKQDVNQSHPNPQLAQQWARVDNHGIASTVRQPA